MPILFSPSWFESLSLVLWNWFYFLLARRSIGNTLLIWLYKGGESFLLDFLGESYYED